MAIDPEIYFDNDADLLIEDLPTGLTVDWFIGTTNAAATAVHVDVSGTLVEGVGAASAVIYTGVLEGAAITANLTAGTEYFLIIKIGQDLRVYGATTPLAVRLANNG